MERVLNGLESAALIPVIYQIFYNYQVGVRVSGVAVGIERIYFAKAFLCIFTP